MTMDVRELVKAKARAARNAARTLALCPTKLKNDALGQMAHGLIEKTAALLEANRADVERARSRGAARAFLDRLTLTETDRKSTRLNSSHLVISYAVFCLKKKKLRQAIS